MIETSMQQYMAQNSKLKYIFFGGKGGVGKTVMAGAAAIWAAQIAAAPAITVLPTPPFPPKKMYFNFGF